MLISRCYGCESDISGWSPHFNLSEEMSKVHDTAVKHGALQVILAAMSSFPNNKLVQRSGCATLCSVSLRKPVAVHMVTELDGVVLLVAAMKRFPNCAKIHKSACWAVSNLSLFEECREPIVQAGGLECLGAAIRTFNVQKNSDHEIIQDKARCAMIRLL